MLDNDVSRLIIDEIKAVDDKEKLVEALTSAILHNYTFPSKIMGIVRYLQLDYQENNEHETAALIKKRITNNFNEIFNMLTEEKFEDEDWGPNFLVFLANELGIATYQGKIVKQALEKEGRLTHIYAFPSEERRIHFELKWQRKVVTQFFRVGRPLKEGTQSYEIYTKIQHHIGKDTPFKIDGLFRRSFVIGLSKILTSYGHMPLLHFQLGKTIIRFEPSEENSKQRQKGNFKMVIPAIPDIAYGEGCIQRIKYLVEASWDDSSNRKKRKSELLKHIKDRLQKFASLNYKQFNKYGNINCFNEEFSNPKDPNILNNIHLLNGLIFLVTVVEVLVRLYRQEDGSVFNYKDQRGVESDSFPVAMAQARSIHLLLAGKISFTDFFGETKKDGYDHKQHRAYFGAVTGLSTIDHIDVMYEKLCAVNEKRNLSLSAAEILQGLSSLYKSDNPEGQLVKGRSLQYFDLKDVYGSASESDEDTPGYSDSEDSELNDVITYQRK